MPGTALGVEGTPEREKDKVCSQGTCILDEEPENTPTIKRVMSDGEATGQQGRVTESKGSALDKMVRERLPEEAIFELRYEG